MLLKIIRIVYHAVATAITIIGFTVILLFLVGIRPYAVQTGSMEPEIMTGSLCFVNQNVSFSEIHEGDIVAFRLDGGMLVTHRVKEVREDGFVTKGDANNTEDATIITNNEYIGKTIYWIPKIGYLFMFLHTRNGMITGSCIFLVFFLAGFLFDNEEENGGNAHDK